MENLTVDSTLRRAIAERRTMDESKQIAIAQGFKTLWQDGREKLMAGNHITFRSSQRPCGARRVSWSPLALPAGLGRFLPPSISHFCLSTGL